MLVGKRIPRGGEFDGLPAQEITGSQITPVFTARKNDPGIIDRAHSKTGMEAEADMGRPVMFLISKRKNYRQILTGQNVRDLECDLARILFFIDSFGRQSIPQSSGLFGKQHLGRRKNFCSDQTMIPSPDFFAFIPGVFAHQTMDEITHDGGMTLPSTGRNARIAVPVQISDPILSWCALG